VIKSAYFPVAPLRQMTLAA